MVAGRLPAMPDPDETGLPSIPQDLLAKGKALQKAGTPFVTAIVVQRPRDLDKVVAAIDREAEYAGEAFWYGWVQAGERIEGPTIGLANSLAREWTNCAVTCALEETEEAFYVTARFIDLEKGSQMERLFRQRKGGVHGKYDPERKLDIALQIGISKAIRNVIVNAVPRWLVERAIEKAKEAVTKKIDPKTLEQHKKKWLDFFAKHGITTEQLIAKAGRPLAEWTTREIVNFQADAKALQSGEVSIGDLFPAPEVKAPEGPIKVEDLPVASSTPKASPPAPALSNEPSEEEKALIKQREIATSKPFSCAKCDVFGADRAEEIEAHLEQAHGIKRQQKPERAVPAKGGLFG